MSYKPRTWISSIAVLVIALATVGIAAASTTSESSTKKSECVPVCFKHPITGELLCTPPCP